MIIVMLSILLGLVIAYAIIATIFMLRFANLLFELEKRINNSFKVIIDAEDVIERVLNTPLFFDSEEVKSVLMSIKRIRSAIINIANDFQIVKNEEEENE